MSSFQKMFRFHKTRFGGHMNHQYGINMFKGLLAIILVIATGTAMNLRDHNKSLYTGWSLFGLALIVIGLIILLALLYFAKQKNSFALVLTIFVMGIAVAIAFYALVSNNSISFKAAASGVATFAVIGGCIIGIIITEWWPPQHWK